MKYQYSFFSRKAVCNGSHLRAIMKLKALGINAQFHKFDPYNVIVRVPEEYVDMLPTDGKTPYLPAACGAGFIIAENKEYDSIVDWTDIKEYPIVRQKRFMEGA